MKNETKDVDGGGIVDLVRNTVWHLSCQIEGNTKVLRVVVLGAEI